jgi:6-phosphofructokinase 1
MRIGVLTGGGDCPGLNAVIRAIVKASHASGWEVTGIEEGFQGLLDPLRTRLLTLQEIRGILPTGGTILGTSNIKDPFKTKVVIQGEETQQDLSSVIVRNIGKLGLDALIAIGGDGTLKISNRLFQIGCPMVGVPKTIDNDILATDVTFGFRTAVNTATEALDKLHTTAESHHRVIVVEVMGRYVGWIALEAGIAGGADVILIPEIPFDMEKVRKKIQARFDQGRKFCIVVVAEGSKPIDGEMSILKQAEDGYILRLGGIGNKVGEEISQRTGLDVRVTVLGHLQRGGSPNSFDRLLATRFGVAAVELIAQKRFGEMVCLRTPRIESVPIQEAIKEMKTVPPDGDLVKTAEVLGISFGR